MTFSEYLEGLYPYLSEEPQICKSNEKGSIKKQKVSQKYANYVDALVINSLKRGAADACEILGMTPDTKYRYVRCGGTISQDNASYLYQNHDPARFEDWIDKRIDATESYDDVAEWLTNNGIMYEDPIKVCAELFKSIVHEIALSRHALSRTSRKKQNDDVFSDDLQTIKEIREKIKSLRKPRQIPVPDVATEDERKYINELLKAYGDAEDKLPFSADDLKMYPSYDEDLKDRRIDFYAAESIRRSFLELKTEDFEILKEETHEGVKNTVRMSFVNGYERMLAVMEKAAMLTMHRYLYNASPNWIGMRIKMGVCHHLVNDGRLAWIGRKMSS